MARRIALLAALAPLVLPAFAGAATPSRFFAGTPVDGPSADIQSLGDLDVARDGTGALAYVKRVAGSITSSSRGWRTGPSSPRSRSTPGWPAPAPSRSSRRRTAGGSSWPTSAAAGSSRPCARPERPATPRPQQIAASGENPAVDMSINGVAYLTWSTSGDVLAARMERAATAFNGVPGPLDIDPAAVAGTGTGRPKVAVAADGIATVVWGEGGDAYARRIFELRLSTAPQDLGAGADEVDISGEDDSSFAWAVFRQGGQTIARRLVGSQFDDPVALQAVEGSEAPRVAINGRGVGYAGVAGTTSAGAYGAVLKDDLFNPSVLLGGGFAAPAPVPAVAETGDGLIAFQQGDASGGRGIIARPYDYVPASRAVTQPGAPAALSNPALGLTDASRGLEAAADRAGDIAIAFVQGDGDGRQIMAASLDRAPGSFRANTTSKWRKFARPPLKWGTAFELWGPLTYNVLIDNKLVAQTTSTGVTVPGVVPDGLHRWRVVATDIRGQSSTTPSRNLRVDATPPKVTFKVSGSRKRGQLVKVAVQATDASSTGAKASGLDHVRISFGDGSRPVVAFKAIHRYGHSGKVTLSISAIDKAGNTVAKTREITIRK